METKVILKQGNQQVETWTGSKYLSNIGVGNYTLELSVADYSIQKKSITITENNTTNVDIKLEKRSSVASHAEPVEVDLRTPSIVNCRDIDGNVYKTVKIGNQIWMAENLKVTHYRNGDEILKITDNTAWSKSTKGALCAYDNNDNNIEKYGYLYSWECNRG